MAEPLNFRENGLSDLESGRSIEPYRIEPPKSAPSKTYPHFDEDFGKKFEEAREAALSERLKLPGVERVKAIQAEIAGIRKLNAQGIIRDATDVADETLRKALSTLPGEAIAESSAVNAAVMRLFPHEGNDRAHAEALSDIRRVWNLVRESDHGIRSPRVTYFDGGLFCHGTAGGYAPSYTDFETVFCSFMWEDALMSYAPTSLEWLAIVVKTVIHEACHRVGGSKNGLPTITDHAYEGKDRLNLKQARANADSYAELAMVLAKLD